MPLTSAFMRLWAISVACILLPVSGMASDDAKPAPVEVWHVGDDIYTAGLVDALERGFRSSPDFVLSNDKKPGTLVVTIPTNLTWKRKLGRTTVFYSVEFASVDGRNLGTEKGSCSKAAFAKCAARIIADARGFARGLR
jgi:hypothetical protein